MVDLQREVLVLEAGINLEVPHEDFQYLFHEWDAANGTDLSYSLHSKDTQRQALMGMIEKQRSNPEDFFNRHRSDSYEKILEAHTRSVCFQHRPKTEWLGFSPSDTILPLPWWPKGHPD